MAGCREWDEGTCRLDRDVTLPHSATHVVPACFRPCGQPIHNAGPAYLVLRARRNLRPRTIAYLGALCDWAAMRLQQPQIYGTWSIAGDVSVGGVVCAEALCLWQHSVLSRRSISQTGRPERQRPDRRALCSLDAYVFSAGPRGCAV